MENIIYTKPVLEYKRGIYHIEIVKEVSDT